MEASNLKLILKSIHISTAVLGGLLLIGGAFVAYQKYHDLKLTKLQIKLAERSLANPEYPYKQAA